jgi:hypothetical protein
MLLTASCAEGDQDIFYEGDIKYIKLNMIWANFQVATDISMLPLLASLFSFRTYQIKA